jgi:AcrR family transcriptional regulator
MCLVQAVAAPLGARERRKIEMSAAIERIAVELALEIGADSVTVEMICERALLSHRSFYNYFPTKEAALFGSGPRPTARMLDDFRNGTSTDVVGDLLDLLARTVVSDSGAPELFLARRRLLQRDPSLALKAMPKLDAFVIELTDLTLDRLRRMGRGAVATPELHDEAAMIVALANAVMQRSMHAQIEADDDTDPRAVLDQSMALARRILSEGRK